MIAQGQEVMFLCKKVLDVMLALLMVPMLNMFFPRQVFISVHTCVLLHRHLTEEGSGGYFNLFLKNAVVIHNRELNIIYVQFVNPEFEGVEVFLLS